MLIEVELLGLDVALGSASEAADGVGQAFQGQDAEAFVLGAGQGRSSDEMLELVRWLLGGVAVSNFWKTLELVCQIPFL